MDQRRLIPEITKALWQYLITCFLQLTLVRQDIRSLDTLVVVQELELAIERVLYGFV